MAQPTPLEHAVSRIGDRWTLLVVDALLGGPRRFSDLAGDVGGIAPNVLTSRLRHLEHEGLVLAEPYQSRPRRVAYRLTPAGHELAGALRLLATWGARHGAGEGPHHDACGTPLDVRWWCPTCERAVGDPEADELRFV